MLNVTTVSIRRHLRVASLWVALPLLIVFLFPSARGAAQNKHKKEKQDKPEKIEPWVEIRTSHFVVISDGGEKMSRRVADQFEQVRRVFQATMPDGRFDTGIPIYILAARNAESFAKLFPESPVDKRRPQPVGVFFAGAEKNYVGLRTNVSGPAPYEEIYQQYARLILKLSYHSLPAWLDQGYENVYGSLTLTDKGARLGRPDPEDLSALWESPLLPLDIVLHVDRTSAYYNTGSKPTVWSAESRALVHFLLTDPQMTASKNLDRYIAQVEGGADALQAARQVFGDLNQLQTKLEAYIKQSTSAPSDVVAADASDTASSPRTLSPAEAEARMGDFAFRRGRTGDAGEMLEDAIKQDPSLAEAEQSLGFLALHHVELDDAENHFKRAAELGPNDALTFYGQGLLAMSRGGFVGVPVGAVAAFEKTVALNANFAPAWYNLASIYALRPETLQKALTDAQRAAELAPGESGYQLQVAALLERLGRTEEARKSATQIQNSSSDNKTADKAGDLLAEISKAKTSPAASPTPQVPAPSVPAKDTRATPAAAPADRTLRIERKTEPDDKPSAKVPARDEATSSAPAPPPTSMPEPSEAHVYSMIGTITDVSCGQAPQVQITLKAQTLVMKLHATDIAQLAVKSAGSSSFVKNPSCSSLRGRSARVSYLLESGKSWDGEMQTVEFR